MALCPFAVHELLPENNTQNRINPTTVICHRAVSSAKDLYGYWNSPGITLESHFYISEDGTIYQYMDTTVRADANVDANAFAVSIETWDGGNTPDDWGWNGIQILRLKQLIKWICDTHGIKKAPAQTWNGGGIGGHNWFPYPWADGPRGCPGTARNKQLREDIIPSVASGRIEDGMSSADAYNGVAQMFKDMAAGNAPDLVSAFHTFATQYKMPKHPDVEIKPDDSNATSIHQETRHLASNFKVVTDRLDVIEDKVEALSTGTGYTLEQLANAVADKIYTRMGS